MVDAVSADRRALLAAADGQRGTRTGGATDRPFVGRRAELDRLLGPVDGDTPATLAVVGPPGIGKSALLAELGHRWAGPVCACAACRRQGRSSGAGPPPVRATSPCGASPSRAWPTPSASWGPTATVVVDDLHHGDELAAGQVRLAVERGGDARFVLAWRPGTTPPVTPSHTIELGPLPMSAGEQLLEAVGTELDSDAMREVVREGGGVPLRICAWPAGGCSKATAASIGTSRTSSPSSAKPRPLLRAGTAGGALRVRLRGRHRARRRGRGARSGRLHRGRTRRRAAGRRRRGLGPWCARAPRARPRAAARCCSLGGRCWRLDRGARPAVRCSEPVRGPTPVLLPHAREAAPLLGDRVEQVFLDAADWFHDSGQDEAALRALDDLSAVRPRAPRLDRAILLRRLSSAAAQGEPVAAAARFVEVATEAGGQGDWLTRRCAAAGEPPRPPLPHRRARARAAAQGGGRGRRRARQDALRPAPAAGPRALEVQRRRSRGRGMGDHRGVVTR